MVAIFGKKRTRKGRRPQMGLKLIRQFGQMWDAVVVADGPSGRFPDVLLWIAIGRRSRCD
jgi:hypothetical protein